MYTLVMILYTAFFVYQFMRCEDTGKLYYLGVAFLAGMWALETLAEVN